MSYNNDTMMSLDIYEALMDHYFPEKKAPETPTYLPLPASEAAKYTGTYLNTRFRF